MHRGVVDLLDAIAHLQRVRHGIQLMGQRPGFVARPAVRRGVVSHLRGAVEVAVAFGLELRRLGWGEMPLRRLSEDLRLGVEDVAAHGEALHRLPLLGNLPEHHRWRPDRLKAPEDELRSRLGLIHGKRRVDRVEDAVTGEVDDPRPDPI